MSHSKRPAPWDQGRSAPPSARRENTTRHRDDLVMVDSMALVTIKIPGSNKGPGLSVYNDSSGGGRQLNIYTKLAEAKSTICFKVDSEDAALQAYRQVRDMNPSAPVGGIMFGVTSKVESQSAKVKTVDWSSLIASRSGEATDDWSDLEEALFQALLAKRPGKEISTAADAQSIDIDSTRSAFGFSVATNTQPIDSPGSLSEFGFSVATNAQPIDDPHSALGSIPDEDT